MILYISPHIKAHRKLMGLSQKELGQLLGRSQTFVSQMESQQLIPDLRALEDVANALRLPKRFYLSSHSKIKNQLSLNPDRRACDTDNYKIPLRYSRRRATCTRALIPLIRYVESHLGKNYIREFFAYIGIDSDILSFYNYHINSNLFFDLLTRLINEGKIKDLSALFPPSLGDSLYSRLPVTLKRSENIQELFRRFSEIVNEQFEANHHYQITEVSNREICIKVERLPHLKEIDMLEGSEKLDRLYFKAWMTSFPKSFGYHFNRTASDPISPTSWYCRGFIKN